MKTYCLITNTSGCKYWSYIAHSGNALVYEQKWVKKYGIVFVNRNGGYFPPNCVDVIHETLIQENFPDTSKENV